MLNEFQGRRNTTTSNPTTIRTRSELEQSTSSKRIRSGDPSKNLSELRKRLLSRNRIYAVPDESSNGPREKLHLLRPPPALFSGSQSSETFFDRGPLPLPNTKTSFHEQVVEVERRIEIIAPDSSLDLWDCPAYRTGTVKRRPQPGIPISVLRNRSLSAKQAAKPTAAILPAPVATSSQEILRTEIKSETDSYNKHLKRASFTDTHSTIPITTSTPEITNFLTRPNKKKIIGISTIETDGRRSTLGKTLKTSVPALRTKKALNNERVLKSRMLDAEKVISISDIHSGSRGKGTSDKDANLSSNRSCSSSRKSFPILMHSRSSLVLGGRRRLEKTLQISHSQIECDKNGDSRFFREGLLRLTSPPSRVCQRLDSQDIGNGGSENEDDEEPDETLEEQSDSGSICKSSLAPTPSPSSPGENEDEPLTNEMRTLKDLCYSSSTCEAPATLLGLMSPCQEDISCFPISSQVLGTLNEQLDACTHNFSKETKAKTNPSELRLTKTCNNEIRTEEYENGESGNSTGCGYDFGHLLRTSDSHNQDETNSSNQNKITDDSTSTTSNSKLNSNGHQDEQEVFSTFPSRRVVVQNAQNDQSCPSPTITLATFSLLIRIESNFSFTKIYTDWANHYLEKARCKRHIQDLQVDVTDGVILADVVEAVTNQKVSDVSRKPKNASQMLDNIQSCLVFLAGLGVSLEGITARDIRDGHLKSILSLFFQLSRYKQQQKQQDRDRHNLLKQSAEMHSAGFKSSTLRQAQDSSKLPSPFGKHGGNTSIPIPSSTTSSGGGGSTLNKKMTQDKSKSGAHGPSSNAGLIGNGSHLYTCGSVKPTSGNSSRSTSPSAVSGIPQSFIPTTRTSIPSAPSSARSSLHEKHINNAKSSSIGQPSSKSSVHVHNNNSVNTAHLITGGQNGVVINGKGTNNTSMLEKFKFFKDKDKGDKLKSSAGSKRTSSSSGFSSARSERSDSSVSLCGDSKTGLVEGSSSSSLSRESHLSNWGLPQQSSVVSPVVEPTGSFSPANCYPTVPTSSTSTSRQAIKGFRQRLGKVIANKESKSGGSPKNSRKELFAKAQLSQQLINSSSTNSKTDCLPYAPSSSTQSNNGINRSSEAAPKHRTLAQTPRVNMMDSTMVETNGNNGNPSFLRHPKPSSANTTTTTSNSSNNSSRDSRNRFSGTGIPSRNSITSSPSVNPNSSSASHSTAPSRELEIGENPSVLSSMNTSSIANGTGIPKPTAAVKGTTKPISVQSPAVLKDDVSKSGSDACPSAKKQQQQMINGSATAKINSIQNENNDGISVALVSPMPPLNNVLTSLSSLDSTLSQSNSNSSDTSVIFLNGHEGGLSGKSSVSVKDKPEQQSENIAKEELFSNSKDKDEVLKNMKSNHSENGQNCRSPIKANCEPPLLRPRGINGVIVECDEDELMLNVTPMEPLEPTVGNSPYGYMKSPPGSGYMSPKSSGSNFVQMNRLGGILPENGNNGTRVLLASVTNRQVFSSPYGDPARLNGRKQSHPQTKYNSSQYAANMGEYDYMDLDNLDISAGGYLSDGDLLLSGTNGNRPNDGYLSESGASIYSRNRPHATNHGHGYVRSSKENSGRNNKHVLITEDRSYVFDTNGPDLLRLSNNEQNKNKNNRSINKEENGEDCGRKTGSNRRVLKGGRFDDSSSLSSGISDLNEIPTDLTSSSVNSELSSPYASLQRSVEENGRKKREPIDPQSIIYRVVGCRSGNSSRRQQESHGTTTAAEFDSHAKTGQGGVSSSGNKEKECNGFNCIPPDTPLGLSSNKSSTDSQLPMNSSMSNGFHSSGNSSSRSHGQGHKMDGKSSGAHLEDSRKRGIMGMKDEHYTREMAERLIREERDRDTKERHRSTSRDGHNGYQQNNGSSGSSDGSGSKRSGKGSSVPITFGYVRRSTGSGMSGGNSSSNGNVSMTKYSIPVNGKMQMINNTDDYKIAHHTSIALMPKSGDYYSANTNPAIGSPKPRTKVKVSGGTQTTNDLHEMGSHHHPIHHTSAGDVVDSYNTSASRHSGSYPSPTQSQSSKSLSLTTPTATQLSQSLRERILGSQSLPKGATASADYAAILATIQQQQHQHYLAQQQHQVYGTPNASKERMSRYNKMMMNDGSLSDTGGYSNYAEIQAYGQHLNSGVGPGTGTYSWMRHSAGYASSITSAPTRLIGGGGSMTEAESLESLSSTSSLAAQLRDVRSNSLTQGRIPTHQRDTSPSRSPRLNRSSSISHFRERTFPRSTKSEKLYPSMLQRTDDMNPYYSTPITGSVVSNMPTSPIHSTTNRLAGGGQGPYLSTQANNHSVRLSMSPYSGFFAKIATKEDEINGSSLSLVSTASSIYSSQEDKHAYEVRKLSRELQDALEKVQTLTNQLSTNAHVVAAFEQSLSNMTQRLQALTSTAEQKDSELMELRQTIEFLRKQSIEAGLTVTNLPSGTSRDGSPIARQLSADSVSSINSISSACSGTSHSHTSSPSGQVHMTPLGTPTHNSQVPPDSPNSKKKHSKNKGWLRSSFTKAFSRSKAKSRNGSISDQNYEDSLRRPSNLNGDSFGQNGHGIHGHYGQQSLKQLENSAPASPLLASPHGGHSSGQSNGCGSSSGSHSPHSNGNVKGSSSSSAICDEVDLKNKSVDDMKKQLREKEMVLTDIRLEALTSAHQLESLKETVTKMRNEMQSLKQDNERLQRLVTCKSLTSSQTSLQTSGLESLDRRLSATEIPAPSSIDILLGDPSEKEGKRFIVSVFLGCHGSYERYVNAGEGFPASECAVGTVSVSSRTKWDLLDSLVRRAFKDYVMRVDPVSNLGLSADSILSYNVGEVLRSKESPLPELLPCGYLVGDVNKIRICLKGALYNGAVDALAFETLIPKSIVQRYITWLTDHGRMILCGPSGTGKSYLARKLGEFFVARSGKDPSPEAIATFSADHKNNKELRQYLSNLAEQCESNSVDLPSVIILDNLHQVSSFGEVFNGFLHSRQTSSPLFIGTMSQSTGSTANLQLHHNFRWVLFGNNVEPVKGTLTRFLRRRVIEVDVQSGAKNIELSRVFEWIPDVWQHINRFLERHNSADVSIGPRLFLSCPTDVSNSQVWFTDLWHYSIVPYIIEAVKEGLQLYGKKVPWEDPTQYLLQTYPWTESLALKSSLLRLRPEDVGYDMKSGPPVPGNKVNKNVTDHDPLMNMLMRLQEAANYSGPQSNDSDTTSLDSHASLDSKDFIATA